MDSASERPHRTTSSNNSGTSELFVCFTSRLSSSSMKLSSKSILSPSRTTRDPPQISLSSSLSRRLKTNGSMKGGQASPMFPTAGKRRGCGFENPEPSSPKVTCIGQVRVKTKKQGKKMRARSKRRGEASFRKTTTEHSQGFHQVGGANPDLSRQNSQSFHLQQECLKHRNQRWVHLPMTICEALRELSCFFPCRSSCMSREKEKGVELGRGGGSGGGDGREGSCGAAFQRWLVALQEGDGKGRGIELVMEEENENENDDGRGKGERSCSQRRHVFEDIDIDLVEGKKEELEEEEEKGRVSICIPPKNALLLMRCRSDPVKMAALANRFWESPVHNKDEYEEQKELDDDEEEDSGDEEEMEKEKEEGYGGNEDQHIEVKQDEDEGQEEKEVDRETKDGSICERESETNEDDDNVITFQEEEEAELDVKENYEVESNEFHETKEEEEKDEEKEEENGNATDKGETFSCVTHSDLEKPETQEEVHLQEGEEEKESDESSELSPSPETFTASEPENDETKAKAKAEEEEEAVRGEASSEGSTEEEEEEKVTTESEQTEPTHEPDPESKERENGSNKDERERETLPECLLLMMCEPKLSMEVSKETWVCSTDFIRWLPERPAAKTAAAGGGGGKRVGVDSSKPKLKPAAPAPQPQMQPPRSSCSFPVAAGASMATMIEQKLVGSKSSNGYEPFVLTRCKSEPMRSSAKLAPEACFWNNRKLEPHPPPAQLGVGAQAGVGF